MKFRLLILTLVFSVNLHGQQVINGGIEQWDTTYTPFYPVSWMTTAFAASVPEDPIPLTAWRTSNSHSGNYAVKLEADDGPFTSAITMGYLAYGSPGYPYYTFGIPYNQRPGELNFYYKFNRMGLDTGFVYVKLHTLDNTGHVEQIVGEGNVSIINDTNTYTPMTIPIYYFVPDTPNIIQIVFATSKALAETGNLIRAFPGNGVTVGTTLWIDDVSLSGGTLGKFEFTEINPCNISPNPFHDFATILFDNPKNEKTTLTVFDYQGKLVKTIRSNNPASNQQIIKRTGLANGFYFFQLATDKQLISTGKFIIE
ncbi:MAG: T9SS type A sorting domain-containing protein [Bacteroidales bacterium]|nr:T9SS type A sorting domain-containing protein [Bacteroidales bacterium]MCF8455494.1 T9SS type A sorting domain-containing protein [Bacteroidales bacterium]